MKAHEFLDKPHKWTQGALARDSQGRAVNPWSPRAVRWCTTGAIYKCYNIISPEAVAEFERIYRRLSEAIDWAIVERWNDLATYQEVYGKLKELDI